MTAPGELTDAELERYSRQLVLPQWSAETQRRLADASVLIVGAGALGSPAAAYLAAAGVGRLGIADDEDVELSNLGRQILHYSPDVGVPKAESAAFKLRYLNPEIVVDAYRVRLEPENAEAMLVTHDVVIDGSDSFATRYLINDACCGLARHGTAPALVEGGVLGLEGLVLSVRPRESACYRCVFPQAPPGPEPRCSESGVLGPVAGVVGSLQALEAVKLITGVGEPLLDRMLQVDGSASAFTTVHTRRRPDCAACGGTL
jgi:adenylyltransferase/sulfurtransferase